jgi:hypothetical protein
MSDALTKEAEQTSLSIESITDGVSERGIPNVKFVEEIDSFSKSFNPPASAELMIGAFSDIFGKMKGVEGTLGQRAQLIQSKIPEIEKSLKLVTFLKSKEAAESTTLTTRYNLADMLFAKAEVDCASAPNIRNPICGRRCCPMNGWRARIVRKVSSPRLRSGACFYRA